MHSPINASAEEIRDFWNEWLSTNNAENFSDDMWLERSVYDLMKVAIDNEQYAPAKEFTNVKRVIKFWIKMPRSVMKQTLGIETWSVYGQGLFTLIDGVFMSPSSRASSGYDTTGRHSYFDLSSVPEDIKRDYEFSLATPAFGGLFIPKKCSLTRWMNSVRQIQYFDLST